MCACLPLVSSSSEPIVVWKCLTTVINYLNKSAFQFIRRSDIYIYSQHTKGPLTYIPPVAQYNSLYLLSEVLDSIFGSVLSLKKQKNGRNLGNRASLSNHNISQNLHRYFNLYGISCWRSTCSWLMFGAILSSFLPFINSFESI